MRHKKDLTRPFAKLDEVIRRQRHLRTRNVLVTFALFAGVATVVSALAGWV